MDDRTEREILARLDYIEAHLLAGGLMLSPWAG